MEESTKNKITKKRKIKFICLQCDKTFDRVQRLQAHQQKLTCGTNCGRCNRKFQSRTKMLQHQKNNVLKDCVRCDKKFCSNSDYNRHLMSEHSVNPNKCETCCKEFKTFYNLQMHCKNAKYQDCDLCDKKFCTPADLKNHIVIEHRGGQLQSDIDEEYESILKQVINPPTGFEDDDKYKEIVEENRNHIKDKTEDGKFHLTVNKEILPGFTYDELAQIIVDALQKRGKACKFNIGFGIILQNNVTNEYRYHYVSGNQLLFNKARTISKIDDVKDILKDIYHMNLGEHYYMQRPASAWILVGITNVQFKLFHLGDSILG